MENKNDIVVHIGAPKTGSSALQYFLLQNRNELARHGYFYPSHDLDRNNVSGGHFDLCAQLVNNDMERAAEILSTYLEDARAQGLTLLISSESLYFYPEQFKSLVGNYRVQVLGFFRDPLESIQSIHGQLIKRHYMSLTLEEYCNQVLETDDPNQYTGSLLLGWRALFGEDAVKVFPYDVELLRERRIEERFLKMLGISSSAWTSFAYVEQRINQGYTATARELKRVLNAVLGKEIAHLNHTIAACLQSYSDNNPEPAHTLEELLENGMLSRLRKKFGESNRLIKSLMPDARPDWLNWESGYTRSSGRPIVVECQYSLGFVACNAFANEPGMLAELRLGVARRISGGCNLPDMVRLADAVGIRLHMIQSEKVFTQPWLEAVLAENSGKLALLQATALLMEDMGNYDSSIKVIDKAMKEFPTMEKLGQLRARMVAKRARVQTLSDDMAKEPEQ